LRLVIPAHAGIHTEAARPLSMVPAFAEDDGTASRRRFAADKIEFWTFSMKPKFTPYFETLVRNYESANPGVKVEWVDFPWDIIQTKLVTRIVAGTPPALVNSTCHGPTNSPATACSRQSTLLADARPRYLASTLEDLTFGGKTYGFPMYSNVAVIAYNTQIFKRPRSRTRRATSMNNCVRAPDRRTYRQGWPVPCPVEDRRPDDAARPAVIKDGKAVFNSPGMWR
jgi:putative chitobiose transport system substrate-binding protein